jgi:hypothetical protein
MFKGGQLSPEELAAMQVQSDKGGKDKKRAMIVALTNMRAGDWIDIEDTYYSYVSVRARVSELSAKLGGTGAVFRTQRIPFITRVFRLR